MLHTRCLAVLETMWGGSGKAPGIFRINPDNFTGRRLYWFLGHKDLWVTNACRELVSNARLHGTPDPEWLSTNLKRLSYDLLLVCGKVAQQTFEKCGVRPPGRILLMPHPAARTWTRASLGHWQKVVQGGPH
jgi:hypothetical protein